MDKIELITNRIKELHTFNTEYSCFPEKNIKCDMLNTKNIDFIFNPYTFSVEIIANRNMFIDEKKENIFLPAPTTNFSQFFTFNGVGYWSKDKTNSYPSPLSFNSQHQDQYNFVANSKTSFERFIFNTDINWTNQQNNLFFENINLTRYYRGYNL